MKHYQAEWYTRNREAIKLRQAGFYAKNRNAVLAKQRARRGIPDDAPLLSPFEKTRRGHFLAGLRKATSDPVAMKLIESRDPRRAKLMRLAVDEGATPYERYRAQEALQKHTHVIDFNREDEACRRSQTTYVETQTRRLLPRSTSR